MAYIKTLKDNELIGGTDNTDVYPVSTSQAIFRQNPDGTVPEGIQHQRLEDSLQDHETDAKELHRKAEKLVPYLSGVLKEGNNQISSPIEINGNAHTWELTATAYLETYGDEPSALINLSSDVVTGKAITVNSTTLTPTASGDALQGVYTFPDGDEPGSYVARFAITYNGVSKNVAITAVTNLRKYFGFAAEEPTDPTVLGISHFSNSVGCTVTIPINGTGFKHIYFAIPDAMTITRVVQPDALNAPLAITQTGTITRNVGGTSYTYKLYKSTDLIDSSASKRLTIS